ncbi:MAG: hypothetical protein KC442_10085 [Thermomicrobiales bacterium]|nr:hypothetical protein [Thermomicrobiales bacterium]
MSAPHVAGQPPLIAPAGGATSPPTAHPPVTVVAGLWALGLFGLYIGLQQQFLPLVFYERFPGFGMAWVAADGPYNEHLMRDLGGANLALTFLIFLAIARPTVWLVRGAAIAVLIAQVPHFVYHALHLGLLPTTGERVLQTASLGLVLLVPVLVLIASRSMTEGRSTTDQG